jgi:hypothetical protein
MISTEVYNGIFLCMIISLFVINNYYQIYLYNKGL